MNTVSNCAYVNNVNVNRSVEQNNIKNISRYIFNQNKLGPILTQVSELIELDR